MSKTATDDAEGKHGKWNKRTMERANWREGFNILYIVDNADNEALFFRRTFFG